MINHRFASATKLVPIGVFLACQACGGRLAPVTRVPTRALGRDLPVYQPSPTQTGRPEVAFEHPTGAVSLRDAIALALLRSPDLAAFAWETRAREARLLQAGGMPNPVVAVLAEDLNASGSSSGGSGAVQVVQPQTTVQLSQLVELGGKRTARQNLAAFDRDLAAWDYEATRMEVLTRVTHAFIDVLAAQEMLELTAQTTQLGEEVRQRVGARVVAGVVSPIEETRAGVALASARVESDRAVRLLDASRARLAAHWGASEATFQSAVGDLDLISELPTMTALTSRLAQNPDLARWAAEISQREAAIEIEQAARVPDLTLTAGYRRFSDIGGSALVIGGSISLPVFDRNRGGTEEARSRLAKAHEERRAAEARVSAELAEGYRALASAYEEVTALRSSILPGARQNFEAVSEGYRLGRFGYLDVLDVQRTSIAAAGQYLRALSDYHKAVADVERLIGTPLAEIVN